MSEANEDRARRWAHSIKPVDLGSAEGIRVIAAAIEEATAEERARASRWKLAAIGWRQAADHERAALRAEADRQAALAEAAGRELRRPAESRVAGGKGGRPGAQHVYMRLEPRPGRDSDLMQLRIGRAVYDAYQLLRRDPSAPLRLAPQISGGALYLTEDPAGYAVSVNAGGVTINVSGSRDELARLEPLKRYPARAQTGRIVVDL